MVGGETPREQPSALEQIDHRVKLWLLIVSLLTIAILAAAALHENVFTEWRRLGGRYAEILAAKATDALGREAARQFEPRLVQNFIPELDVVDRCLTCHAGVQDPRMADQPLPFTTHPGRHLQIHDPEKFGCTVCHAGQGRATETADAHGRVPFWDQPMLERPFLTSSCTKCHIEADLFGTDGLIARARGGPGDDRLEKGRRLVRESGCLGCHVLNGKGGSIGPDLTTVGNKTRHELSFAHFGRDEPREVAHWLRRHFLDPAAVSPGSVMPPVRDVEDAEALVSYMLSLRSRAVGRYFYHKRIRETAPTESGRDLYAAYCSSCHGLDGKGGHVASIRTPSLNHPDVLAVASDDFYRFTIEKGRSNTRMPAWGEGHGNLSRDEIDAIVGHLRSWEPDGPDLTAITSGSGDPERGAEQYQRLCAGCHGTGGEGGIGSRLNSATFLAVADDSFLAQSIVHGRPGTAMPSWKQLSAQAVSDLLAFVRSWQVPPPSFQVVHASMGDGSRPEMLEAGRRLYADRCASCHGGAAEGGLGPSLASTDFLAAVDDEYLYRAIIEGRPSTAMPAWRHLGADEVAALIAHLRTFQGSPRLDLKDDLPRGDPRAGKMYYDVSCAGCHGAKAVGGSGPQLSNPVFLGSVSDGALFHWIAHGRPGTAMRGFGGNSQDPTALTASQIADVIAYLRHLGSAENRRILQAGAGNADNGRTWFASSCAPCHGPDGEGASGPQLNNSAFLRAASDGYLTATIAVGRSGTAMLPMAHGQEGVGQIPPGEIPDIVASLRLWQRPETWRRPRSVAERSERAVGSGAQAYGRYCAACHGPNGRGEADGPAHFAPALNNPEFLEAADDGFLLATIARGRTATQMIPFGKGAGGPSLEAAEIKDIVSFMRSWQKPAAGGERSIPRAAR